LSFLRPEEWAWLRERVRSLLGAAPADMPTPPSRRVTVSTAIQNLKK
jgi:hypothetical protein